MCCCLASISGSAIAQTTLPEPLRGLAFEQRLDSQVPQQLTFTDHHGSRVALGDYFGTQPIILHMAYYRCPMLCNMTREGLITTLRSMSLEMGQDFTILTVSFDPRESTDLAAAARETALQRYRRPGAEDGWHFLTGDQTAIHRLCEAVGFRARWDSRSATFAHASGLIVLTPRGRVSRYLNGVEFAARDLRLALVEASAGRIGSVTDQVMLFCFMYDPQQGRYGFAVIRALRIGGVLTVCSLVGGVAVMLRRERRRSRAANERTAAAGAPTAAEEPN